MIASKDLSNGVVDYDGNDSRSKWSRPNFDTNKRYLDEKDFFFRFKRWVVVGPPSF